MKKMRFVFHLLLYLLSLFLFLHGSNCSVGNPQSEVVEMVNVHIGSISHTLEPTLPTVHIPHGMIRLWPIVSPGAADRYTASRIYAFPLNQPAHRYPNVGSIMAAAGEGDPVPSQIASEFDHALEIAKPYYYGVLLEDDDIWAEYSPTERAVFYQFKFNQAGPAQIFISAKNNGHFQIVDDKTMLGKETFEGVTQYFYLELNVPFTHFKLYKNQTLQNPGKEISGDKLTAALRYELPAGQTIGVKYGISYISEEQAKQNLENEIPHWSFEAVKTEAQEKWNSTLAKIQIKGGTPDQRVYFYTALYRCFERMVNITEDGKYYSGYDHQIHEDTRPFYVDDWIWDTYRSLHPLRLLIEPEKEMDMIQSYVRMYEQSGWMPTFPQIWGDRKCMIGHHQAALIADAYFKGLRDFDLLKAYEGLRKNAMEGTMIPWQEGPALPIDQVYREKGFFPALSPGQKETIESVSSFEQRQSVAVTLEHAYDDWCLAQLAKELDKPTDFDLFMKRA
ncbi:GH92 family glycosyl hydrolase, partial [candidate division KSB1 bacterium]|nr:GH92 family glycosyl hydrolase [candidate division KSB1 bacterium]